MHVVKKTVVLSVLLILPALVMAQDPGQPCDGVDPDLACPLDGGTLALMAAGALFGIKKLAAK